MLSGKLTIPGMLLLAISLTGASLMADAGGEKQDEKTEKAARQRSADNLHELMKALWNHHEVNGYFPPAMIRDRSGKPLLSWRVLLLPYLDQDDLFAQFHLDEPWDSEHNKPLLAKMPRIYAPPLSGRTREKHATFYQVFVGKGTIFEGEEGVAGSDITDGTSNTIMIVEAAQAVPWTRPSDLPYDEKKPLPKLGGLFGGGFHAALADGSVRFLTPRLTQRTLRSAITRNDGHILGPDF